MDLLIKGATIIDGTGKPGYIGDVGIIGDKLTLDTKGKTAKQMIDATGLMVAPGFIDAHSHGDMILGQEYAKVCKLAQGITTEVGGQCGQSMYPIHPEKLAITRALLSVGTKYFPQDFAEFDSMERYLEYVAATPIAVNLKTMTGHNNLRLWAMGYDNRKPTADELEEMKTLLREAMEHGSMGLSSGLIYPPSSYGELDELVELAKIVKEYNGVYATHMRNESGDVVKSVEEAIEVGRRSGVKVMISHHKVLGQKNWGLSQKTLALVDQAVAEGIEITIDQYPYTACMTNLNVCIPPKYFTKGIKHLVEILSDPANRERIKAEILDPNCDYDNYYQSCGGFDRIFVSSCPVTKEAEGCFVGDYARKLGKDPFDTYFDLLIANNGESGGIYHAMGEEDIFRIFQNPNTVVGTDGLCLDMEEKGHPRAFGSFTRAICWYHKEKKLMPLEEVIRKMTSLTAQRVMLQNKGEIKEGYDADLVIFDYDQLKDTPSYQDSNQLSNGIEYVIVNGQIVYHDKKLTGINSGRFIPHTK